MRPYCCSEVAPQESNESPQAGRSRDPDDAYDAWCRGGGGGGGWDVQRQVKQKSRPSPSSAAPRSLPPVCELSSRRGASSGMTTATTRHDD